MLWGLQLFFSGQVVLAMRSLAYVDAQTASMITMGAVVLILWMIAPFMLKADYFRNLGICIQHLKAEWWS